MDLMYESHKSDVFMCNIQIFDGALSYFNYIFAISLKILSNFNWDAVSLNEGKFLFMFDCKIWCC